MADGTGLAAVAVGVVEKPHAHRLRDAGCICEVFGAEV